MPNQNEDTYMTAGVVDYYSQLKLLQPAEQNILDRLRRQLPTMKMLDIGIGGGRTTKHFAPLVETYTGIDYSSGMIAACQKRFNHSSHPMNLQIGDARNMAEFAADSFDFILFSFNGIDYVSHGDRLKIFTEIKRIGKTGCYVFFSSHNLQAMKGEFDCKQKISFNPITTYVNLIMLILLRIFNFSITRQKLEDADYLILRDESHNFRLKTYYVQAEEQIRQLENGFDQIEVFSWKTGSKILKMDDLVVNSDLWLYYFCRVI